MSIRKIGYALAIIGVSGALISTLIDTLGFGDDGIQVAQLLGIELGIVLVLIGFGLVLVSRKQNFSLAQIVVLSGLIRLIFQLSPGCLLVSLLFMLLSSWGQFS